MKSPGCEFLRRVLIVLFSTVILLVMASGAHADDIRISTGRFTLNTLTGNQSVTGVGFQPKAYILFYTKNASDDANSTAGESLLSVGMTDGTNQFCMASGVQDAQDPSDVGRRGFSDRVLASHDAQANQTVDGEATHVSMDSDGFTINIVDNFADPASPLIHYIAFGGVDLSVHVDTVDLADPQDGFVDVTAPGFEPDVVIASYIGVFLDAYGDTNNDDHSFSLGWAVNPKRQASGNQFSMSVGTRDGQGTTQTRSRFDNVRAGTSHRDDATDAAFQIDSFDTIGFNVTTRLTGAVLNESMGYMALKLGPSNPLVYTVARTARTLTGNDVESGAGFPPIFLLGIGSAVVTTANSNTNGGSIAIGITDSTNTYAISQFDADAAPISNTHSRITNTQFMSANLHTSAIDWEAAFSSFNYDGWTINYGDAAGSAYQNAFLAIGGTGIRYIRSGGTTGTSFSFDIGTPNTNRLVVVIADDESTSTSLNNPGGVTVDGKNCNKVTEADNSTGAGNHMEMWYCDEHDLGSSSGTVTIAINGGDAGWGVHAHLYTGVAQSGPTDYQIDNTSAAQNEILPAAVDIPANGLLVCGAANGQSGSYNDADWDTNPTPVEGPDDGLSPEIEMTEVTDGPHPSSAILATAYWISSTGAQTNRLFRARGSVQNNRGTGIVASWGVFSPTTYYVRKDGNNTNPGTSNTPGGAWLTIQKAANTMLAGDTVLVQEGTYYEMVQPANSGTLGNPITYRAEGTVVIDGQNTRTRSFELSGDDYIVIDGFEHYNVRDDGGTDGNVKLVDSDYVTIRNNIFHDTGRDAIHISGTSTNALIENNLIYNISDDGITPGGSGNHTLRNNTIYNCGGWALEGAATTGNLYENNIFWHDPIDNTGVATYNYNDYNGTLSGTGNINSDPLFVNAAGADFHLSHTATGQGSDSPCKDAGSDTAANLGLDTRTTRTDQVTDTGTVDMGFHYPFCKFSYRRSIVIDHTKVGTDNSGTLPATGFPVLVSLSGNWLKTTAVDPTNGRIENANGYDIIFRESDGRTGLYHEIEEYDGTNGTLVAWVRVDSLSKAADTTIYMYYGNACITSPTEDPENVWDSSFKGVWHLKEATDATNIDSTSNANNGTPQNSPAAATGKISGALNFEGAAQTRVDVGTAGSLDLSLYDNWTISAWVKPSNNYTDSKYPTIYTYGDWGVQVGIAVAEGPEDGRIENYRNDTTVLWSDTAMNITEWNHVVVVRDSTTTYFYLNGGGDGSGSIVSIDQDNSGAHIGGYPGYNDGDLMGLIDEVRVSGGSDSSAARSADWIKTEHNNQSDTTIGTGYFFKSLGSENASPATAVTLASFTANGQSSSVLVEWETAHELNHMGFYLYRARSPWGPFTRLTDKLISGLTSSVVGRKYSFEDKDVTSGEIYYYRLEDLDIYGSKTLHGPICVDWDGDGLPDDWEIAHGLDPGFDDAGLDSDEDGLTNWEEYLRGTDPFNPDTDGDGILDGEDRETDSDGQGGVRTMSPGVYILAADETGTTLELRTDSFDFTILEAEGQEYERLRITEYIHGFTPEVGKPELPLKGILVDIPQGNSATLTVLQTEDELHTGYRIYPVPENVVDEQDQLAHVGETFVIYEAAYNVDVFYPDAPALLGKEYLFRGQQKQQIFFHPLTFNPATGEVRHYRRIRVRVDYAAGEWAKASDPEPTVWSPSVADEGSEDFSSYVKMAFLTPSMIVNPIASVLSSTAILTRALWAPPAAASPAYKILVVEDGIYRLNKAWLEAQSVDVSGFDLSQVRIYNLGQEIAIYVYDENGDDLFDPEDSIYFYGRAVEESYAKYTTDNVYWLTLEEGVGAPKRMEEIDSFPVSVSVPLTHSFTVHHEEDREYWARAPGGDSLDRYFFQPYVVGATVGGYIPPPGDPDPGDPVSFDLFLPGAAGQGTLKIMLGGTWDTDHQVAVSLNGSPVGTYSWSDIAFYEATIEGVGLRDGDNTITLECLTGEDNIAVDWFKVTYPRRFEANGDLLRFSHQTGYRFQVTEFSDNDLLAFDITSPVNVDRVINFETIDTGGPFPYTLDFEPPSGSGERTYLVLTADQVKTPDAIVEDDYGNLANPATGADYILITHRDLGWDGNGDPHPWLHDLTALRQAQGLWVKAVDVQDVFDEFSYGISAPEAIRDFLTYAYSSWTPPAPQYVLLVGDSSRNPKNNPDPWFGLDTVTTYLPIYLTVTEHMGETAATDEWFARVSGDDAISDLYIGRLPAKSTDEATAMVNKILAYEGNLNTKSWEKDVLLLADDQGDGPEYEYEAVFEIMNDDAAALLPAAMSDPFKGYLNDYFDADVLNAEILAEINSGTLIVNYSGHSSIQRLANPNIFKTADVATLTNSGMYPLFVGMGCLSGNFVYPEGWNYPSLAEALLRAEDKGAAAALMSTGLTTTGGQHILNTALFEVVFNQDVRVLGQAVSVAKQTLIANGGTMYDEVNETFLLFGDPAMTLKVPLPQRPAGLSAQGNGNAVDLSWDEATDCNSGGVSGYNLYRSTTPGGTYTQVNTSLITETQYDDTSVVAGTTYYYVVTSVDADGDESAQSQEANGGTQSANSESSGGGGCFIDLVAAE